MDSLKCSIYAVFRTPKICYDKSVMAMVCNKCGKLIGDFDLTCPVCGAPVGSSEPPKDNVPKTIDELRKYAEYKHMPLDMLRFYIGMDYRSPRAFGIYKDPETGVFIVYKNKADGSRSIRYSGTDEAFAVNELYLKLIEEHAAYIASKIKKNRRPVSDEVIQRKPVDFDHKHLVLSIVITAVIAIVVLIVIFTSGKYTYSRTTYTEYYYEYDGTRYIFDTQDSRWYYINSSGSRLKTDPPEELLADRTAYFDHSSSYTVTTAYSNSSGSSYRDNDYSYESDRGYDSDSGSGSGSDWGSDSGGGTDWDSDW